MPTNSILKDLTETSCLQTDLEFFSHTFLKRALFFLWIEHTFFKTDPFAAQSLIVTDIISMMSSIR